MLVSLLMSLFALSAKAETISDFRYLRAGERTPAAGYWAPESYGQDIAAGWKRSQLDAESWQRAYEELREEVATSISEAATSLNQVQSELQKERREWARKVRRRTLQSVFWGLLIGGVGGAIIHNNM
jgi:hypothetical protein